jgi:hypothetical protein
LNIGRAQIKNIISLSQYNKKNEICDRSEATDVLLAAIIVVSEFSVSYKTWHLLYAAVRVLVHHVNISGVNFPVYFHAAAHNPSISSSAGNVFN